MPKWAKTISAVLLLPFCAGAVSTLLRVLRATGQFEAFWIAFFGGAACWLVVFLLLPKPMLVYVFGHELTHVVWAWLCGGKVRRFKATSKGGHVVISKSNFLIVLAPYFFPLYAVLVVTTFGFGHLLFDWARCLIWFHFLLGAAYSFHVTLTGHILRTQQSDIISQGYLFSAVIILLGNISVLLIALPLFTARVSLLTTMSWWLQDSGAVLQRLSRWF
jgi:hypothetical protein